ncbi:MAG TPA: tetratricopeptide repeat protein [Candidatus Angelobacter sp.]|nr:tetratricopeptide repeat protein [Candidatus Angelobacter sp.]
MSFFQEKTLQSSRNVAASSRSVGNARRSLILALTLLVPYCAWCEKDRDREKASCPTEARKFASVEKKAELHDAAAQTILGSCYETGRHVTPSRAETIHWLSLAANQGYAPAEYELARIYLFGRGVPADYAQALLWEKRAAEQGEPEAQRDLAYIYHRGLGTQADAGQAAFWNRKAALQGEPEAQLRLAEALEKGYGTQKNTNEAQRWYLKAAQQNQPRAQLRLAQIYAGESNAIQTHPAKVSAAVIATDGNNAAQAGTKNGPAKNDNEANARSGKNAPNCKAARFWYQKAAENGQTQAMYELGRLHQDTTCGLDREEAFLWFQLGGRFGSQESQAAADKLAPLVPPDQQAKIARTMDRWIGRHSGAQKEEDEEEKD